MTDTYERCSCGARDRAKCSKESLSGGGKLCVKDIKEQTKPECHWACTGCDICGSKGHGESWF